MTTPDPTPRFFSRENLPRIGAAVFSGAVLKLVSPPIGWDFIHWLTFVPLFVAVAVPGEAPMEVEGGAVRRRWTQLRAVLRTRNFRLGYLTGFSGVFLLFFWLAQTIDLFSNIPLVLAALIVALFAAVFGLPYGFLAAAVAPLRRLFGEAWVFMFATLWVTMEFAQPALFPYYQGVGQYRNPYTWQLASVFGAYGVSWLIILTNSTAAELWLAWRARRPLPVRALVITLALFLGNLGFGFWRFNAVEAELHAAPSARVSLLQQGVTMVDRIQDRGTEVLKSWLTLTAKVAEQHPDLVVWPEGSIYYNPTEPKVKAGFGQMTKQYGFAFLLGGGTHGPDPANPTQRANWNSAYLFGTDGEIKGRYDKMVPMPFGEYLPWPVSYLKPYITGVGSFRAGSDPTVFRTDKFSFTVPICYEAILEAQMRRLSTADVYVNITNDGWFGDTAAPHQHAMLAAAYAVEMGRPMLRIAYTGISMVVEPHGVIRYETKPYTEAAEVVELRLAKFETPYRTWGRAFPYVCTTFTLLMSLLVALGVVTPRPPRA
ncbi:apolipoprotein N-acyltransferase [Deltaproteobacteria bacterium]|nr:apolipoprotein N-acyltransferase [Deltaproteobacteria bacterium]